MGDLIKKGDCGNHSGGFPIIRFVSIEKIATKSGGFTSFMLLECGECGKIVPFPDSNLSLITEQAKEDLLTVLKKNGYELSSGF